MSFSSATQLARCPLGGTVRTLCRTSRPRRPVRGVAAFRAAAAEPGNEGEQQQQPGSSDVPATRQGGDVIQRGPRSSSLLFGSPLLGGGFPTFGRMADMMRAMEEELNSMLTAFDTPLLTTTDVGAGRGGGGAAALSLAVDVKEEDDAYVFSADVPGVPKENIKVTVGPDNTLTISGERSAAKEVEDERYRRVERSFGSFVRRFRLPADIDASGIQAKSEHGVLMLRVPKHEHEGHETIRIDVA